MQKTQLEETEQTLEWESNVAGMLELPDQDFNVTMIHMLTPVMGEVGNLQN